MGGAKAGDEVIITSGTYEAKSPIPAPPSATNVQIHGDPSGPKPKINAAFVGPVFSLTQTGDSLSYVDVENSANGGLGVICFSARLDRISVRVVGSGAIGAFAFSDCTIRNSLFRVDGVNSTGVRSIGTAPNTSASLAERDGNCVGLPLGRRQRRIQRTLEGSFNLDLLNSIAQGDGQI